MLVTRFGRISSIFFNSRLATLNCAGLIVCFAALASSIVPRTVCGADDDGIHVVQLRPGAATLPAGTVDLGSAVPAGTDISGLIVNLGAVDFKIREEAQNRLVAAGVGSLAGLQKAADGDTDPEIRSRAAAAIAKIKEADGYGPSLITVRVKDGPVTDVLKTIGEQAHVHFAPLTQDPAAVRFRAMHNIKELPGMAPNLSVLSLNVDHKPYWEVMADVCSQLHVCPVTNQQGVVQLGPQTNNWVTGSPHEIVGPYWVSVAGFSHIKQLNLFGTTSIDDQFSVRLAVFPEPKLPVKSVSRFQVVEAKDDLGNSLLPLMHHEIQKSTDSPGGSLLESSLTYPEHPGTRIALLKGQFDVLLATGIQQYRVEDVLGAPKVFNSLSNCPVTIKIESKGLSSLRVLLTGESKNLSYEQFNKSDIVLVDESGVQLQPIYEVSSSAPLRKGTQGNTFFINQLFSLDAVRHSTTATMPATTPKVDLIWSVPTSFRTITVPLLFNDLPMP
jgi:hypothetical protein